MPPEQLLAVELAELGKEAGTIIRIGRPSVSPLRVDFHPMSDPVPDSGVEPASSMLGILRVAFSSPLISPLSGAVTFGRHYPWAPEVSKSLAIEEPIAGRLDMVESSWVAPALASDRDGGWFGW